MDRTCHSVPHSLLLLMLTTMMMVTTAMASTDAVGPEVPDARPRVDNLMWWRHSPDLWNQASKTRGAPNLDQRGTPGISAMAMYGDFASTKGADQSPGRWRASDPLSTKVSDSYGNKPSAIYTSNPKRFVEQNIKSYLSVGNGEKIGDTSPYKINWGNRVSAPFSPAGENVQSGGCAMKSGNPKGLTPLRRAQLEVGQVENRSKRLRDVDDEFRRTLHILEERRRAMEMRRLTMLLQNILHRKAIPAEPVQYYR